MWETLIIILCKNIKELNSNIELLTKIKETIKMKKLKDQFENALNIYDSINWRECQ